MRVFILVCFSFLMFNVSAQKIKRESVQVEYTSRPSEPLPKEVKSYSVEVMQTYKLEFEAEMEQWAIDTEIARVNFTRESQEYSQKGTGAKLLERALLDEKKPALVLPSKPVKREFIFEAGVVSSKIDMQGMNKNEGGVVVTIDIQSFESTSPEDGKQELKDKEGNISYKYYRTMTYRQQVRFAVTLPDGDVVIDEVIGSSENYIAHTSNKYTSKGALNKSWNQTSINSQMSKKAVNAAMGSINNVLNDRVCFSKKTRPMTIYHVKTTKKVNYTDLNDAALDMELAIEKYYNDQEVSMAAIREVIPVWESAIAEADFDNRKARIDSRVAGLIYLNLIYANIWLEEYDRVDVLFDEMRRLDTKKSAEGAAEGLDTFSEDQRARKEVNS
ncbi:MAG: hypothetical protein OSA78_05300 [Flavobacteriales bacterium]|nr:hypothetical protein [Flavobacteriales bacterium]